MAAPYSDLQSKAEAALMAIVGGGVGIQVVAGLGAEALELPRAECTADQGEEDPPHAGNFWLTFTVTIRSNDGLSTHRSLVASAIDVIMVDTLAASLTSGVADFTCQGIRNRRVLPQEAEDRTLSTAIQFEGVCCPQDFPN